ncbi:MAG: DUF4040 domain-containing protein [Chloroflexi bacterium]|nr:DUF4040 domain-containing protein [Chloroflexota bacterium]
MLDWLLVIAAILCALQVVRSPRLLSSALWLAGVSALVSILLYRLGAPEVAVIELSVGAGLVTVLFVFAFNIVGEEGQTAASLIPRPLIWGLVLLAAALLGWYTLPAASFPDRAAEPSFAVVLWEQRGLDVLVQVALIFSGVMGLTGLLGGVHQLRKDQALQETVSSLPESPPPPLSTPEYEPAIEEVQV